MLAHRDFWRVFSFLFIVVILNSGKYSFAQNFNPPFPRIGQIYLYPAGAGDEIWKNHDMIAIRHYLSSDAQRIRKKNPDIIILGANDAIEGTPIEELLGKKLPEEWYVHYANGERLPIWGGHLMNITEKCPEADFIYGRQKFNQFVAQYLIDNTDRSCFDGSYWDSWISGLQWMGFDMDQIDFDYDGQADGAGTIQDSWYSGNEVMIQNQRAIDDRLIIAHEAVKPYLNGNAFEFWSQVEDPPHGHTGNLGRLFDLKNNAVEPIVNYCNGEADGALFRADLTSAMLGDAFFGHDEGTYAHRYTYLHDEYEANLGYPAGSPEELESGLWIRYFDHGAIISNISGQSKTVRSSQLNGGPYWRFQGSQEPNINNGDPFDANHPVNFEGMDGIVLLKEERALITPIIIDNVAHNMTSIDQYPVKYSGSWEHTIRGRDYYGLGYAWDEWGSYFAFAQPGTGNNTASYRPRIKVAGDYEVFEWHGRHDQQSASNAPYSIKRDGAVIGTGRIDQTGNIGQWNSIGVFSLTNGNSFEIVLSDNANGIVISDAFKFEFIGDENMDKEP